jgi:hypothetical protein
MGKKRNREAKATPRLPVANREPMPADRPASDASSAGANGKVISDDRGHKPLEAAFGTTDKCVTLMLANQTLGLGDLREGAPEFRLLEGIQPQNEIEGMLAVQMLGAHNLAVSMLHRARTTDRPEFLALFGNLAVKALRVFAAQTEAMARLRGQTGQQTVRVEHVTVEAGGQAVVGAVAVGGTGDGK